MTGVTEYVIAKEQKISVKAYDNVLRLWQSRVENAYPSSHEITSSAQRGNKIITYHASLLVMTSQKEHVIAKEHEISVKAYDNVLRLRQSRVKTHVLLIMRLLRRHKGGIK